MSAEAERKTETIPEWKREEIDELVSLIESHESIGIVGVAGIPSRQLQTMRGNLYGTATLRMSRNTLLQRALDDVDAGVEALDDYVAGQIGLIVTNDNPFTLYRELEASKSPAPISAGEVSPNDIVLTAGDTGVDPGPFVGELQQVGAAARIQDGSIHITEDSQVLDAGEEVSADLANVLNELGIEPKEVGLDLQAVYSEGVLFEADELAIDVEEYEADIQSAVAGARNLALNTGFPTAGTLPLAIAKATGEAKNLGLQATIESPDLADDLVSKADAQMRALAAQIEDEEALPEELRGVEAPAAPAAEEPEDESTDEDDGSAEADAESEAEEDADEDEEATGEGLGDLFG